MACWLASNLSIGARLRLSRVQIPVLAKVAHYNVKNEVKTRMNRYQARRWTFKHNIRSSVVILK